MAEQLPKVTAVQLDLLRLVEQEKVLFTMGMSRIKGMNKNDVFKNTDTGSTITAPMKKLVAAGLASTNLGASRGMSKVVALTKTGQTVLDASAQPND